MVVTPGQISRRADFYFQMASLLAAGVPIVQALEMVRSNTGRSFQQPIGLILENLRQGATFTDAVLATGRWLPAFDSALLGAGEHSGRLDITFRTLGNYYTQRATMLRQILSGLAYPAFILHFAILIFPIGYLTRFFFQNGVRDFVVQKVAVLVPVYALVIIVIVAFQGTHGEYWRGLIEQFTGSIPLVGSARRDLALGRLAGALEALLSAGVPIIQAWLLAAHASGSPRIKRIVARSVPLMESGETPSETLRRSNGFPELFQSLYSTGELSGQLDSALRRLHLHYDEQASLKLQNIANWTPKLVFLLVAIGIGYQIISFYAGYFNQINQLGF